MTTLHGDDLTAFSIAAYGLAVHHYVDHGAQVLVPDFDKPHMHVFEVRQGKRCAPLFTAAGVMQDDVRVRYLHTVDFEVSSFPGE